MKAVSDKYYKLNRCWLVALVIIVLFAFLEIEAAYRNNITNVRDRYLQVGNQAGLYVFRNMGKDTDQRRYTLLINNRVLLCDCDKQVMQANQETQKNMQSQTKED